MTTQTATPLSSVGSFLTGAGRILVILLIILVAFSVLRFDSFVSGANIRNIGMAASILLVMAVGATFVIATGGVDLSVGAVLVFSGVIAAKVMAVMGAEGWGASFVGILVACLAGTAWGVLNGFLVAKAKIPALVATLGTMGAAQGLSWII
uniref:ABC transporter permease n=1 Tax=Shinella sp. TaxID=1870904 RepID=UPI003F708539